MNNPTPIPELDEKGLRQFGLTTGALVAVLFGLFFPWVFELGFPLWPWIVFGLLAAWALVAPLSIKPLYRGWMHIGILLSRITTPIIMGAAFIFAIVPVSVILKFTRWDPMKRKFDDDVTTYRVESVKPTKDSLERPF